jgi:hypothetical protein
MATVPSPDPLLVIGGMQEQLAKLRIHILSPCAILSMGDRANASGHLQRLSAELGSLHRTLNRGLGADHVRL